MAKAEDDRVRRIEELVRRLEDIQDLEDRRAAHALMEAVLELHGSGLERMMDIVYETGDAGKVAIRRFAADGLVSSLLVLHNLHPDDMETRVQQALGKMHGTAELLGVCEGVVRVRLTGSGCGLKESVEAAVRDAVPDAVEIVIEETVSSNGFVRLTSIGLPVAPGTI
jgi:hypothetical protein